MFSADIYRNSSIIAIKHIVFTNILALGIHCCIVWLANVYNIHVDHPCQLQYRYRQSGLSDERKEEKKNYSETRLSRGRFKYMIIYRSRFQWTANETDLHRARGMTGPPYSIY